MTSRVTEPRLISDNDVKDIIAFVGLNSKCDLEYARDLVNDAGCWYAANASLRGNYRFNTVLKQLNSLAPLLKKAVAILEKEDVHAAVYEALAPIPSVLDILALSAHIENKISSRSRAISSKDKSVIFKNSPFEWLIGRSLQRAYLAIFEKKASYSISRQDGVPSGPFIRFCLITLDKLEIDNAGKPYKAGACAEALDKVAKSRRAMGSTTGD